MSNYALGFLILLAIATTLLLAFIALFIFLSAGLWGPAVYAMLAICTLTYVLNTLFYRRPW